ncbi:MAG: sulfite dehydrogenase [Methylobacteriaceae bacterium]|nr:sulfite dehydrogenase [Methylobacteriaceae bacterium]
MTGQDPKGEGLAASSRSLRQSPEPGSVTRRRLFAGSALLAAGGAVAVIGPSPAGAEADTNLPPDIPEWQIRPGREVMSPPYGLPSRYEGEVVRRPRAGGAPSPTRLAAVSTTPLQNLVGITTPNGLHYERHHAGVPDIDPEQHRLMVHGLVERPLIFTMADLTRYPSVSRIYFLECSGNSQTWGEPKSELTAQDTHGLLSCCEWTGVPLAIVLDDAGVRPEAKWILAEGADAAAMTRSIPIEKALDDALLAYAQNGERLRPEQGYPLRLFLPGYEGNASVKWLRRLKLGTAPFETREETSKYTMVMPDHTIRQFNFAMEAKSVITFPSGGHRLSAPGFYEISGLGWSGSGRIKRIEVSTDGGRSWQNAALQEPILPKCLTRFRFPWQWDGGPATLASRATDETGYVQPSHEALLKERDARSYYHNNAVQSWHVASGGAVTNAG